MSLAEQDLREALAQGDVHEGFIIDTLDKASWALRKISQAESKIADIDAAATAEIAEINAWRDRATEEHRQTIEAMKTLLAPFVAEQIQESKKKSMALPKGTVGFKAKPAAYHRQEDVLLEWARPHGFIRVKEEVAWSDLKAVCKVDGNKLISPDGEIVPGVQVEERPDEFYVRVAVGDGGQGRANQGSH